MDEIMENDTILVPHGSKYTAWHRKEIPTVLTLDSIREHGLHPHIRKAPVTTMAGGMHFHIPNRKALTTIDKFGKQQCLDIVSDQYSIIQNEDVYETMLRSFEGVDIPHEISCIGTLGGLRRYFISMAVGENGGGFMVNGDRYYGHINFVTGHDGIVFTGHDSTIRIVCGNTLQLSLQGHSNFTFKVRHKGDVKSKCLELSGFLNQIMTGREMFAENMTELAERKVSYDDIKNVVSGFFVMEAFNRREKLEKGLSTRSLNAINDITDLAISGRGNAGQSFYDVLNGATEYWTSGQGVGKTTNAGRKAYSSEFGNAAEKKKKFTKYLIEDTYRTTLLEVDTKRVLGLSS